MAVQLVFTVREDSLSATTRNISESGVQVITDLTHPKGTLLLMTFPTFRATAEVIWTREPDEEEPARLGMRFVSLSRRDRKELLRLLKKRSARNPLGEGRSGGSPRRN